MNRSQPKLVKTSLVTAKRPRPIGVDRSLVVQSGLGNFSIYEDWSQSWSKPLEGKRPDQTRLLNTIWTQSNQWFSKALNISKIITTRPMLLQQTLLVYVCTLLPWIIVLVWIKSTFCTDLNPCVKDTYFANNWTKAGQEGAQTKMNKIVCYISLILFFKLT